MIKATFGKERNGRVTFSINHKFARLIPQSDQMTMAMIRVLKNYPDAGDFEFYQWDADGLNPSNVPKGRNGMICGGNFQVIEGERK